MIKYAGHGEVDSGTQARKILIDPKLEKALLRVPIESFVHEEALREELHRFLSERKSIEFYRFGRFSRNISAPDMTCVMVQELELAEGMNVLVLGAKSGYLEALISEMVGSGATSRQKGPRGRQKRGRERDPGAGGTGSWGS